MPAPVKFFFDFSSPYGYLAAQKIDALAARHGRGVDWKPMLLGVVFKHLGTAPLTTIPLKGEYSKLDFARSALHHGIGGFRMPSKFPIPTQAAARIVLWLKTADPARAVPVAQALFRAYWVDDRDISSADVAVAVAAEAGVDAAAARAVVDDPVWKDALKRETEAAIARGVFGSPFVIVDGEPFWGLDRFDQLERRLAATTPRDGRVLAVSHLRLIASDLPALVAFYRDVLDAEPAVDVPDVYAEFATAGARLALCGEATMGAVVGRSPPRAGDAMVVCLRVDDVDATHAKLAARGITFVRAPHDQPGWHQRVAHLRDPAGNLVELWTPLASPARAGT